MSKYKKAVHPAVENPLFFGPSVTKSDVHMNVFICDDAYEVLSFVTAYVLQYLVGWL